MKRLAFFLLVYLSYQYSFSFPRENEIKTVLLLISVVV